MGGALAASWEIQRDGHRELGIVAVAFGSLVMVDGHVVGVVLEFVLLLRNQSELCEFRSLRVRRMRSRR